MSAMLVIAFCSVRAEPEACPCCSGGVFCVLFHLACIANGLEMMARAPAGVNLLNVGKDMTENCQLNANDN